MSKLNAQQRLRLPAELADFLDERQEDLGLPSRNAVILMLLQEARKRAHHAVRTAEWRARRKRLDGIGAPRGTG